MYDWIYIIVGIIAFILAITLIIAYVSYRIAFFTSKNSKKNYYHIPKEYQHERKKMRELVENLSKIPFEQVFTYSHDGLKLSAKYYHVSDDAPIQIQFHGYRGSGIRDFSGGNLLARELGFNTLLVDQRAHGDSEGCTISFGVVERYDVISWCNYCVKNFPKAKIYLAGVSMGAASVIMAAELDLPSNVKGIIADCSYSSQKEVIKLSCKNMKVPPSLMFPFIALGGKLFGKFDINERTPLQAIPNAKVPIMLIHGEEDEIVPIQMAHQMEQASCGKAKLYTFANASHGISYIVNPIRYKQLAIDFINKCEKI